MPHGVVQAVPRSGVLRTLPIAKGPQRHSKSPPARFASFLIEDEPDRKVCVRHRVGRVGGPAVRPCGLNGQPDIGFPNETAERGVERNGPQTESAPRYAGGPIADPFDATGKAAADTAKQPIADYEDTKRLSISAVSSSGWDRCLGQFQELTG